MLRFTNQVALVTGATSGMGRATALAFAREGAAVVLAGRRTAEGQALEKEITQTGGQALFVQTDVTHEEQVKALVEKTIVRFGRLDAAFNNAGIEGTVFSPVTEQTLANFHDVMNCNVLGVLLCMKYQIPAMLKNGSGSIINNASVAAVVGMGGMSVYTASKHAVLGLTRSAALEVARQGVRVNCVSPAVIDTEMFDRFSALGSNRETMAALHPVGRIGRAEEVASAVLFLASNETSFMTGSNVMVDGGWTVG